MQRAPGRELAPPEPLQTRVPELLTGARLDRALAQLAGCSRRQARIAIGEGRVQLAGRCVRVFTREVRSGQKLQCAFPVAAAAPGAHRLPATPPGVPARAATLRIVYLDPWVVAVDKPAGLLSEPDRFGAPSALSLLPALLRARGEDDRLWLVHRLDAGTSGLLLFARRPSAARRLYAAFAAREVAKIYHAWVAGALVAEQRIAAPLARLHGTRHGVCAAGKAACTRIAPLAPGPAYSRVAAYPTTGRTHQIRVHLAHVGHPIVGDALYGGPRYLPYRAAEAEPCGNDVVLPAGLHAVGRPLLHAYALTLEHPSGARQRPLSLQVQTPADFNLLSAKALSP